MNEMRGPLHLIPNVTKRSQNLNHSLNNMLMLKICVASTYFVQRLYHVTRNILKAIAHEWRKHGKND